MTFKEDSTWQRRGAGCGKLSHIFDSTGLSLKKNQTLSSGSLFANYVWLWNVAPWYEDNDDAQRIKQHHVVKNHGTTRVTSNNHKSQLSTNHREGTVQIFRQHLAPGFESTHLSCCGIKVFNKRRIQHSNECAFPQHLTHLAMDKTMWNAGTAAILWDC